jgi:hypothetical protein
VPPRGERRRLADAGCPLHLHMPHRYERQLRACGFVGITILWARFGFVTWIAHRKDPTKEEENGGGEEEEDMEQEQQGHEPAAVQEAEEEHKAAKSPPLEEHKAEKSPPLRCSLSPHASSFVHWSLTGALQTDAASAVAFSSDAPGQAFEVCAWGLSQVPISAEIAAGGVGGGGK